jgi:hypothetical protein
MTENIPNINQQPVNQPWSQTPSPLDDRHIISENGNLRPQKGTMKTSKLALILFGIAIMAGIGTGTGLFKLSAKSGIGPKLSDSNAPISQVAGNNIKEGDVFGSPDESTFKDKAEGYLEIGGVNGEGSHHLLRAGGPSQTVYLTSSVTDLDKFQGMEVKVWGETFKAQNAGWLMDVGRVEITKTKGTLPEGNTPAAAAEGEGE